MSTSIQVVQVAASCSERFMCSPILRRIRESCPAPAATLAAGTSAAATRPTGSGRYGLSMCIGGSACTSASTSCLRTRPSRPVPLTPSRSIPCSAAIRRTSGEYRRRGAWAAISAGSPCPAMRARTVPTATVSPTATSTSLTTPAAGAGTSLSILSVEISHTVWSAATGSPTPTFHSTTVPSATDTPIWGIVTSTSSVLEELTTRLLDALDAGQHGLLQLRGERDRHVGRRDPHDRPVEQLEAALGDQRGHLGAGGAGAVGLVEHDDLRAAADRLEDRLLVERHERSEVEHLQR